MYIIRVGKNVEYHNKESAKERMEELEKEGKKYTVKIV